MGAWAGWAALRVADAACRCRGRYVNLPTQSKVICGSLFTFGFYFLAVHSDSDGGSDSYSITIEATDGQQIEARPQHVEAANVC